MLRVVLGMYNLYSGVRNVRYQTAKRKILVVSISCFRTKYDIQNTLYVFLCIVFINLYSYRFNKGKIKFLRL